MTSFGTWSQNEYKAMNIVVDLINQNEHDPNGLPITAWPSPLIDIVVQIIIRDAGKEVARQFLETAISLLDKSEETVRRNIEMEAYQDSPLPWPPVNKDT